MEIFTRCLRNSAPTFALTCLSSAPQRFHRTLHLPSGHPPQVTWAGPDMTCAVWGLSPTRGHQKPPSWEQVFLDHCLLCLADLGTSLGLGQELLAFLLCHFLLLIIPPPQEINLHEEFVFSGNTCCVQ